jgi:hypothetical protein
LVQLALQVNSNKQVRNDRISAVMFFSFDRPRKSRANALVHYRGIHGHTMVRNKQGARAPCYGTGSCCRTGGSTAIISDSIPK